VLVEAEHGTLFNAERLSQIFLITQAIDRLPGVNHHQSNRWPTALRAGARHEQRHTALRAVDARHAEDRRQATEIRRAVHKSEAVYGNLVSLDDQAALVRANLRDGTSTIADCSTR
jgi:hypothetical protein